MARLVLLSEGFTGRSYELKTDKTTVGRVEDNTFEISDPSVSSHHCEIHLQGGEVFIKDLDSTNGTFLDGERISDGFLKPGQILRLGTVEMRLELDKPNASGSAAPTVPPSSDVSAATATAAAAAAATSRAKKHQLDQTRVIPQGVKLDDLEGARTTSFEGKTGFEKKSNRATIIFIGGVILVGIVLVALLVFIVVKNTS